MNQMEQLQLGANHQTPEALRQSMQDSVHEFMNKAD